MQEQVQKYLERLRSKSQLSNVEAALLFLFETRDLRESSAELEVEVELMPGRPMVRFTLYKNNEFYMTRFKSQKDAEAFLGVPLE